MHGGARLGPEHLEEVLHLNPGNALWLLLPDGLILAFLSWRSQRVQVILCIVCTATPVGFLEEHFPGATI